MQAPPEARWDDVRVFLAAFRERALASAGARLGLDASTVSRRIAALEEAVGARLFDRSRDGLQPTRAAELLLPAAESMEASHLRFAREASGFEREAEGVVRLSVAPGVADEFLVPALVRLRTRHPRIRIDLDASVRAVDLTRREADIALRSIEPRGADLVARKLMATRWLAVASPALVESLGAVDDWDAIPWIAWGADLAGLHVARWLERYAPRAEVPLRTSHFASQLGAAEVGLGAVLAPEAYMSVRDVVPLRYRERLAPSASEWPVDDLWLVGHRALRDVPRIAAVWAFILGEFTAAAPAPKARPRRRSAAAG